MTKLLSFVMLSLLLIQSFLLPATVQAQDIVVIKCPIIVTFTTLPATDVTITTAVFNGTITETIRIGRLLAQQDYQYPWVFEYGTSPGVYTKRVNTEMVSFSQDAVNDGEDLVITLRITFKGSVIGLFPCTTYYARLIYLDPIPLDEECLAVKLADEISFRTAGCSAGAGSHQSGGLTALGPIAPPVNLSNITVQNATITATKVAPGEKVDIAASVVNRGGSNGASKVTLYINGQEAESKGVTLASGQSTPVYFRVSRNEPGTYTVYVNGVSAGSFTVDLFTSNDALIYSAIALFTVGIIGVLYLVFKRRTT